MVTPAAETPQPGTLSNTTTNGPQVAAKPAVAPSTISPTPPNTIPAQDSSQAAPSPPLAEGPAPVVTQQMTREDKLAALCIKNFLRVEEIVGGLYSHRGFCTKCGWQSMQHSSEAAYSMIASHVMNHWKDVAAQADVA